MDEKSEQPDVEARSSALDRRAVLDRMTAEATAAGLYDGTPADYAEALRAARRSRRP